MLEYRRLRERERGRERQTDRQTETERERRGEREGERETERARERIFFSLQIIKLKGNVQTLWQHNHSIIISLYQQNSESLKEMGTSHLCQKRLRLISTFSGLDVGTGGGRLLADMLLLTDRK